MAKSSGKLNPPLDPLENPLTNNPEVDAAQASGTGESVIIEVPVCRDAATATFCLHIDARLTIEQSNALRRTVEALDRQNARLENGKRIVGPADGVKFILERLVEAVA